MAVEYRLEQFTDRAVLLDRVTQVRLSVDDVVITPAFPGALDDAGFLEFSDEPKSRALSHTDPVSHVAKSRIRVVGKTNKHVGVVAQECPVVRCISHRKAAPNSAQAAKGMTDLAGNQYQDKKNQI